MEDIRPALARKLAELTALIAIATEDKPTLATRYLLRQVDLAQRFVDSLPTVEERLAALDRLLD